MTQTQYYTDRADVNSSAFSTLWYDAPSKRAFAEFNSGTVVGYEGVESSTFEAWKSADSPGTFWRAFIKKQVQNGNYKGVDGNVFFQPRLTAAPAPTQDVTQYVTTVNVADIGEQTNPVESVTRRFQVVLNVEAESLVQAATLFANEEGVDVLEVAALV